MRPDVESGWKAYSIYELEAGQEWQGLMAIYGRMNQYNSVEGYKYSTEILASSEEMAAAMAAQAAQTT